MRATPTVDLPIAPATTAAMTSVSPVCRRVTWERALSPALGQFTSFDPSPGDLREPRSIHTYLFSFNDPVVLRDPSGQFTLTEQQQAVGIANGLSSGLCNFMKTLLTPRKTFQGALFKFAESALASDLSADLGAAAAPGARRRRPSDRAAPARRASRRVPARTRVGI